MQDIISTIAQRSHSAIHISTEDFVDDGVLHCGICRTPKEKDLPFGRVRILCRCAAEKRDAEEAERKAKEIAEQIAINRRVCFPDKTMVNLTFAADDGTNERISSISRNYVDNFPKFRTDGKGLLFFGTVGTGKSFQAAAICNSLLDKGYRCHFTNFARLINEVNGRRDDRQEYLDALNRFDLLAIDDLGAERDSTYMAETIFNLIDGRCRAGLPLLITTNLAAEELKNPGENRRARIYSRLLDMCIPVEVQGIDRRKRNLCDNFAGYAELLGIN